MLGQQFMKLQNRAVIRQPQWPSIGNKEYVHSDHSLAAARTLECWMNILTPKARKVLVSLTETVTNSKSLQVQMAHWLRYPQSRVSNQIFQRRGQSCQMQKRTGTHSVTVQNVMNLTMHTKELFLSNHSINPLL